MHGIWPESNQDFSPIYFTGSFDGTPYEHLFIPRKEFCH